MEIVESKTTGCATSPDFWCHFFAKDRLREGGLDAYYQICYDDNGAYMVRHSSENGLEDLEVVDDPDSMRAIGIGHLKKQWQLIWESQPHEWFADDAVISYFKRENWQKMKRDVDKWRRRECRERRQRG
jgi:hypothetical protein